MSQRFLFTFILGLTLMIAAGVGAAQLRQQNKDLREFQAELEGATRVEGSVLTQRQRVHSRLFNGFRQNEERISDLIAPYKGKRIVYGISISYRMTQEFDNTETPEILIGKLTGESDAVVRGRVADSTSGITDDGNFVFTDYSVIVNEVLKNNEKAPLTSGTTITVTFPGGKVLIDDVIVKTSSNAFGPLPVSSHVVLFLSFLPETGDYKITRYNGAFELDGSIARPIAGQFLPAGFPRNQDSFLETARALSSK